VNHTAVKDEIDEALANLPPLSPGVMKIVQLANDLSAAPRDLMNSIKLDPSLTVKILNLVNSVYFSLPQKITSLNRALILLGFNTIKNIALSSAIVDAVGKNKAVEPFWRHLLAVGVTSKMIAECSGQPRQVLEEYFISGLLHDIGDMMLMRFVPESVRAACDLTEKKQISFQEACQTIMQTDGPAIGARVIVQWKLPEIFNQIVGHRAHFGKDVSNVVNAVHLADKLVRRQSIGFVADKLDLEVSAQELTFNSLQADKLKELELDIISKIDSASVIIAG